MKKTVTLVVNGKDLIFDLTPDLYNKYIDEIQATKKVGPTQNLLMRSVRAESKEDLKAVLAAVPGAVMLIGSRLIEEYTPDLEITVGE